MTFFDWTILLGIYLSTMLFCRKYFQRLNSSFISNLDFQSTLSKKDTDIAQITASFLTAKALLKNCQAVIEAQNVTLTSHATLVEKLNQEIMSKNSLIERMSRERNSTPIEDVSKKGPLN